MPWAELRARTNDLLGELGVPPSTYPASQPQRALFTNRTLSLRSIQARGGGGAWLRLTLPARLLRLLLT